MSFGNPNYQPGTDRPRRPGPQERIAYQGEMAVLLDTALSHYNIGGYVAHEQNENGYEDCNLKFRTTAGMYFVKCFAKWRSPEDCRRYLQMVEAAYTKGDVVTPHLISNNHGIPLSEFQLDGVPVNLCIMQFLDGRNIWESRRPLSADERRQVVRQAAGIARCHYRPAEVEDSWAITNIAQTYERSRALIPSQDAPIIEDLLARWKAIDLRTLPYAFVHGDIRTTNVMRHSDGRIYIIDFSVANWYPRIVELAVLGSDILFESERPETFAANVQEALDIYRQEGIELTTAERDALPLFIQLAHAANVIGASSVGGLSSISEAENRHWLELGQNGLRVGSLS